MIRESEIGFTRYLSICVDEDEIWTRFVKVAGNFIRVAIWRLRARRICQALVSWYPGPSVIIYLIARLASPKVTTDDTAERFKSRCSVV